MRSIIPTLAGLSVLLGLLLSFAGECRGQAKTVSELVRQLLDLPAPAPVKEIDEEAIAARERPAEFHSWKNIPPDDAPIEDLFAFWKEHYGDGNTLYYYQVPPSAKTIERLLDHCREHPERITEILGRMPRDEDTVAGVKDVYERLRKDKTKGEYASGQVKRWLVNNSTMFTDELIKSASRIKDENDYVSNASQIALRSLACVDWDAARPHVDRLEFGSGQPYSQILAYWVKYQHAIASSDASSIDTYRDKLKRIVEDKTAGWKQRDLAMDALVAEKAWEGRDEWYASLLSDETLLEIQDNGHTGLTTMMRVAEPGSWRERLLKMLKSPEKAVRSAAARNLQEGGLDKEIVEALLPWLSDPNWAKPSRRDERSSLIEALGKFDIPQAVPLLIAILSSEEEFTGTAAKALAEKKDPRAIPALRAALARSAGQDRTEIIAALAASGGFSDDELVDSLEAFLKMTLTEQGREKFQELKYQDNDVEEETGEEDEGAPVSRDVRKNPKKVAPTLPLEASIGEYVSQITEPTEPLAALALEREKALRKANSDIAESFANVILGWKGRVVYLEWVRRLKSGEADIDTLLEILAARDDIREKLPIEMAELRSSAGALRGIAACINENEQDFLSIIATGDPDSQKAVLGCGRLIRAKMPIDGVAAMLDGKSADLRLAAERFLETEDSVRSRATLLARRPGQVSILGARTAFLPDLKTIYRSDSLDKLFQSVTGNGFWGSFAGMQKFEERLRTEIKEDQNLVAIYAKVEDAEAGHRVIRVFKDKVRFTVYEDPARYREGELSEKEFKDFYSFALAEKIDEVGPVVQTCHHGCPSGEFVMFGRNGGRRNFYSGYQLPEKLSKLNGFYEAFAKKDLKLKYLLADSIKGLDVILADDKFPVHAVWKKDADLRFLVSDTAMREQIDTDLAEKSKAESEAAEEDGDRTAMGELYQAQQKRREEAVGAEFSWRTLEKGKIGPATLKPDIFPLEPKQSRFLIDGTGRWNPSGFGNAAGSPDFAVFASPYRSEGLFKMKVGDEEPVKIKDGAYAHPLLTPDGRRVIAAKFENGRDEPAILVRIDLATGRETRLSIPPADGVEPVRYLEGRKKILVYRGRARTNGYGVPIGEEAEIEEAANAVLKKANPTPKVPEYYLLDPVTGVVEKVRGVFAPLEENGYRALQPSTVAGESWAVIFDAATKTTRIGRYSDSKFTFTPAVELPNIHLSSMDVWVDEKEYKAYFVYKGHLLAVPLGQ